MNLSVSVAPVSEPFDDVRRIVVLRGGGLGDLLFAQPALAALAGAYPDAEITLLGSPVAGELFAPDAPRVLGVPHHVVRLPEIPGVAAPPEAAPPAGIRDFLDAQAAEGYDLAVQLHGGGRYSNPLLNRLGARHTVGTRTPDAEPLERTLDYVYYQHEVLRGLEVAGLAGAAPVVLEPRVLIDEASAAAAERDADAPLVAIHPGATDPRRRWPAERFAATALALLRDGARILLVGGAGDAPLAARIRARLDDAAPGSASRVDDATGRMGLRQLAAALAGADLLVANDSGPRHLAQAVGTMTASVYWVGNIVNAGPLGRGNHRVQLSWTTRCPVCGRDCTQVGWTSERCEHDVSFVADVTSDAVLADARQLMATTALPRGR